MISDLLVKNENQIRGQLETTDSQWNSFINKLKAQERKKMTDFNDEQVWTFLLMTWFAYNGHKKIQNLINLITSTVNLNINSADKIWLEALPIPPRIKEGNTNLDVAIGRIEKREIGKEDNIKLNTGNGIQYMEGDGFIGFCEMKWYSDIDNKVTHDKHRNQLIRVIENALAFNGKNDSRPNKVFVTLVTTKIFKERNPKSRFYSYKYDDYSNNSDAIKDDIKGCELKLKNIEENILMERITALELNWITYENILDLIEEDELGKMIKIFYQNYCGYLPKL